MPLGCKFSIIKFGSECDYVRNPKGEAICDFDENSLNQVRPIIAQIRANLGGTCIYKPLEKALDLVKQCPDKTMRIFVLTDGEVE